MTDTPDIREHKIALLPCDGIGNEVVAEGVKVLGAIETLDEGVRFACDHFPWGCEYYLEHGRMMPPDGLERLKPYDAMYMGAVGDPRVPDHISLHGLMLPLRKAFDLYVNERAVQLIEGIECPIKNVTPADVDMVFVRENTEGEYAGVGGRMYQGTPQEVALQTGVFTRHGTERIIRYAFELARRRRRHLTSVTKSNALNYSMVFWDEVFADVAREYPDVKTASYLVDAMCLYMIQRPSMFDVVVASNLFGDILTDLGAAIQGGLGMAIAANLNPERTYPSLFEPVHGSAPDIAGQEKANPIAAIGTLRLMLAHLGEDEWAAKVDAAVRRVVAEKKVRTPDMGGTATTGQVGDEVVRVLREQG